MNKALVIENDPTDDLCRLGDWLTEAGLNLQVIKAHEGEAIPETLDGYVAFVVLGGEQDAYGDTPWFRAIESLLRKAVRYRIPTLGICLGGQLLAQATGGMVERSTSGLEIGSRLVAKRDAAGGDVLFGPMPFAPDVIQYHRDEITELPAGATLLFASPRYPHQGFRVGDRAWGVQFHIECDSEMFAGWVNSGADRLREAGFEPDELIEGVVQTQDDVEEVWRPFAQRFAALALGQLSEPDIRRPLPLLS